MSEAGNKLASALELRKGHINAYGEMAKQLAEELTYRQGDATDSVPIAPDTKPLNNEGGMA